LQVAQRLDQKHNKRKYNHEDEQCNELCVVVA